MDKIKAYFITEKNTTEIVADLLTKKISKYSDIKEEFVFWLENRKLKPENLLIINGYTAEKIQTLAPHLDIAGVYNFMVTLRDDPKAAETIIKNGFPRK